MRVKYIKLVDDLMPCVFCLDPIQQWRFEAIRPLHLVSVSCTQPLVICRVRQVMWA